MTVLGIKWLCCTFVKKIKGKLPVSESEDSEEDGEDSKEQSSQRTQGQLRKIINCVVWYSFTRELFGHNPEWVDSFLYLGISISKKLS